MASEATILRCQARTPGEGSVVKEEAQRALSVKLSLPRTRIVGALGRAHRMFVQAFPFPVSYLSCDLRLFSKPFRFSTELKAAVEDD